MTTTHDVVIIGAGLAGLAAGATAAAAGADAVVLDAHQPGGRARSTDRDGYRFSMGGHALYAAGEGMGVLRSLGIIPRGAHPPLHRYRVVLGGERHLLPTSAGSLLRSSALGPRAKLRLARLLAALPRLDADALAGTSVRSWLDDLAFEDAARAIIEALVRISTYGSDLDALGADVAATQLKAALAGVLYLDGGWQQLVDALTARVEVKTGAKARAIEVGVDHLTVATADASYRARSVVVAAGSPRAVAALLPADPGWDLGPEVTAACLDVGVDHLPQPGYVLSADEPLYATVQGPPAAGQAPAGHAAMAVIRYGARNASEDRRALETFLFGAAGVAPAEVMTSRFLARMSVVGALPPLSGLRDRPGVGATGVPGLLLAGDWVGGRGFLADASLASGQEAGLRAVRSLERPATMVA